MTTVSLCMIVRDEEHCLARCLNSVRNHVDEIIICDTGSQDRTKRIARAFTDKVVDIPWNESFADARNTSIAKACKNWILVLDADELILAGDLQRLIDILGTTQYDAFFLIQRNYMNDTAKSGWIRLEKAQAEKMGYKGYVPNPVIRVFRNHMNIHYSGVVHEVVDESVHPSKCSVLDIPIHHYWEEKDVFEKQMKYLELTEKELEKTPNGRLHAIAAAIHYNFRQDFQRALHHYDRAAELGYKKNSMLEGSAECRLRLGDFSGAYDIYAVLAQSGYRPTAVCSNLANLMVRRGEYEQAIELLNYAISKSGSPDITGRLQDNIRIVKELMGKDA